MRGTTVAPARRGAAALLASLRIVGPDRAGIVAAASNLLNEYGCNIVQSEHYTDPHYHYGSNSGDGDTKNGTFLQRIVLDYSNLMGQTGNDDQGMERRRKLEMELGRRVADKFQVECSLDWRRRRKRVGVMVSKLDHCLWELLLRREEAHESDQQSDHLRGSSIDIPVIVSNHPDLKSVADVFGVPFEVVPVDPDNKTEAERRQLELFREHDVDVIVLARYMQVLSENFLEHYPNRIINIHHSFLPAFAGSRAYHQAHARGVKLIGATVKYL